MEMPIAAHDIDYAENLLAEGELETAAVLLEELASEAGSMPTPRASPRTPASGSASRARSSILPIAVSSAILASSHRSRRLSIACMPTWPTSTSSVMSTSPRVTPSSRPCAGTR